jgi:hypothetical protein
VKVPTFFGLSVGSILVFSCSLVMGTSTFIIGSFPEKMQRCLYSS